MPAVSQPALLPFTLPQSNPVTTSQNLNSLTNTALAQIHQRNRDNIKLLLELEHVLRPRRRNNAKKLLALVRNDLARFHKPTKQLSLNLDCGNAPNPATRDNRTAGGVSTSQRNAWLGRLSIAAILTAIIGGIAQGLGTQIWALCWPAVKYLLGI